MNRIFIVASLGRKGQYNFPPQVTLRSRRGISSSNDQGSNQVSFQQYADDFSKQGNQNPANWLDYKNHEYLNWNKWSYYDLEAELTKHRLPQPNPKEPEQPRDTIQSSQSEKK